MNNREKWRPTKYVHKNGKLIASRDLNQVGAASRLMADRIAAAYDRELGRHAKGRLLDLGCGKVPLFHAYKDLVTENVCVDWPNTIHRNNYLDFECDLTQPLPLKDGEFNTIILSDVLEHIPRPIYLWSEMSRVLAVNGKILLTVPFYYWLHEIPHDYYRYTEFSLRRFVEEAGLQLVQLEILGGAPEIVGDIFAKNIQTARAIGPSVAKLAQWFTATLTSTRVGKRMSERTRDLFPFGYFLVAVKPAQVPSRDSQLAGS